MITSNNKYIKKKLESIFDSKGIKLYYPIKEMMSDNAAMIAWACIKNYDKKKENLYFRPKSRMKITDSL